MRGVGGEGDRYRHHGKPESWIHKRFILVRGWEAVIFAVYSLAYVTLITRVQAVLCGSPSSPLPTLNSPSTLPFLPHPHLSPSNASPSYARTESQLDVQESPALERKGKIDRKKLEEVRKKTLVSKASVIG